MRVVYDASARMDGQPSLNDCLLIGPKYNQKIFDLLVRFRSYPIAVTADIEKAFLMVAVEEGDRDALRFLWVSSIEDEDPTIRPLRFTRVVFGVCSSPFLLNSTIRYHLEQYQESHPDLIKKLIESFYVDDVVTGASDEREAKELYSTSKSILRNGAFNLRKFRTNSPSLQQEIDTAEKRPGRDEEVPTCSLDETYAETTLGRPHSAESSMVKVLGVVWDPEEDSLQFNVADIAELATTTGPTKRKVVSIIGKFYDPLGYLSPVIIRFKKLFQKLCQAQVKWDDELPENLREEWKLLVEDLQKSNPIVIPRCYQQGEVRSYTLCGFCDASTTAYAAVVYIVVKTESDGERNGRFLASKTRVAPLQSLTVPRLELLSALLLSRLVTAVSVALESCLSISKVECYTDSTVTLHWIKGTCKEWKTFVQNRVDEIRQKTPPELWNHCPGVTNPADLPSRGTAMSELLVSHLWNFGPEWLKFGPASSVLPEMSEECTKELKTSSGATHNLVAADVQSTVGNVIDCGRFSSFRRLVRVTAYLWRAIRCFKKKTRMTGPISAEELLDAECRWIKNAQASVGTDKSSKAQLNLFLDEKGLWRCGGRLANADLPYATKYPLLLPRKHPLTPLIVTDAHRRVLHNGTRDTLTELRRRFWIVKARSLVRGLIHRCVTCRRFEGKPFPTPPPPPLPLSRVKEGPAFSFTGVDFAGPLMVRKENNGQSKVYISLFTCLVTRAVHLDIVQDMSTETFLRCLKRFAARRGLPQRFLSDNGKTFKAASRYLRSVFKDDSVRDHLAEKGCEWTFNVEKAPWWGGAFERMVRSTKRCLKKMVGQASLTYDELLTMIVEIESIINSRPLSYISAGDMEEPLTPSHLLIGHRVLNLPDHLDFICELGDEDFDVNSTQLTKRMKYLSNTLNHFWRRWKNEYLAELRESHKYLLGKAQGEPCVSVGDMVVIHDDTPRSFWKLGRIQELITGPDGRTRGASVRIAGKDRKHTTLNRPLQLLYPLEIHHPSGPAETPEQSKSTSSPEPSQPTVSEEQPDGRNPPERQQRPQRTSARRGREKVRTWISELTDIDI